MHTRRSWPSARGVLSLTAVLLATIAVLPASAAAEDTLISTRTVKLSKHVAAVVVPPRAALDFSSKDPWITAAGVPATTTGATLTIFDRSLEPSGPTQYTSLLPASGWKARGTRVKFAQRTDAANPVSKIVIGNGTLKIRARSRRSEIGPPTLPEVDLKSQGPFDFVLTIGAKRFCATTPAVNVAGGNHRFIYSARNVAAPAACPEL